MKLKPRKSCRSDHPLIHKIGAGEAKNLNSGLSWQGSFHHGYQNKKRFYEVIDNEIPLKPRIALAVQ
jgi:hypothetical protein